MKKMSKQEYIEKRLHDKEIVDLFPQVIGRRNYLSALYDIQEKAKKKVEIVEDAKEESKGNERRREDDSQTSTETEEA